MKKSRNPKPGGGQSRSGRGRMRALGSTVTGTHVPILVEEVLALLKPQAGEILADCTLGYGGHTCAFASYLGETGRIVGLDIDGEELDKTTQRLGDIAPVLRTYQRNFTDLAEVLKEEGWDGVDIIFADLGVSSMQVDDPSRGISYKHKGPLDMRMDRRLAESGADLLQRLSETELAHALREFSDEPDHAALARAIVTQRQTRPITQTNQLIRLVFGVKGITLKQWQQQQRQAFNTLHPAARTFQALRILVNKELESLERFLALLPACLKPGGRVGILCFHSGEDRLVKQAFKAGKDVGQYETIAHKPITPRRKEVMANPRSASAKFRYARKAF